MIAFVRAKVASFRVGTQTVTLGLDNPEVEVREIQATLHPQFYENAVDFTLRLKNIGDENSQQISFLYGLDMELPCSMSDIVRVNTLKGDSCGSKSFNEVSFPMYVGDKYEVTVSSGRPSTGEAFPYYDITVGGTTYVLGIGWSGCWTIIIQRMNNALLIFAGQTGCDFYLMPGESARAPRILLYEGHTGRDDACYGFRSVIREHLSPQYVKMPIANHMFDRYYSDPKCNFRTDEIQLQIGQRAKQIAHTDTFWLDAAWFRDAFPSGVGNYDFEPGFPQGLENLDKLVHDAGQRFMVWFEPERVHTGSDTYKKFHEDKEFILENGTACDRRVLNFGYQPAFDYMYSIISNMIRKYHIDIFRVDHNIEPGSFWRYTDKPNRKGLTEMRAVEGLYAFWDKILEEFPGIMIDNCASGGRRLDIESLSRSVACWVSDIGCSREDLNKRMNTIWNQNMNVNLSRYIEYHQTTAWEPTRYWIRSAMGYGVNYTFDILSDDLDLVNAGEILGEVEELGKYHDGKMIPLTEVCNDISIWFAYELQKDTCGCAYAFRRDACPQETYIIKLQVKNPKVSYDVKIVNEHGYSQTLTCRGEELEKGIPLVSTEPRQSFVVEWNQRNSTRANK